MKGLLKYLSPFAPDQSGAAAVFYEMDCITVVCDAGGCIGNYCGFDEPRWFEHKSPIFSAGLRDMDAILGRDDKMVGKLKLVSDKFHSRFAVLVGTPVPAVIGTDYKALKKMAAKKCGIPVLGIECSGTKDYDQGASDAYLELFRTFAKKGEKQEKLLGILGATPLDLGDIHADVRLREYYREKGYEKVFCYGMGDGYEAVCQAGCAAKNIVISPAGVEAAKYLEKAFGIPFETAYPILTEDQKAELIEKTQGAKKLLVIHQQFAANEIRSLLSGRDVKAAAFFKLYKEYAQDGDLRFETEEALREEILNGEYDCIIGDEILKRAVRDYRGAWVNLPHFAVSGTRE